MRSCSAGQRRDQYGSKPLPLRSNFPEPVQQSTEDSFFLVVIAIADTHTPSVTPDLGREKQEAQACRRQRGVLERCYLGVFLAVEQHQPAVQVVGQHHQLEMVAVHHPTSGWM